MKTYHIETKSGSHIYLPAESKEDAIKKAGLSVGKVKSITALPDIKEAE